MTEKSERYLLRKTSLADVYKSLEGIYNAITRNPPGTEEMRLKFFKMAKDLSFAYGAFPSELREDSPFDTEGLLRKLAPTDNNINLLSRHYQKP